MRQMKGQPKENAREKKERKKEFRENQDKVWTVALPTFGVIFLLIAVSVYLSTRPKSVIEGWKKAILVGVAFPYQSHAHDHFLQDLGVKNLSSLGRLWAFLFHFVLHFKRVYQTEIKKKLLYLISSLKNT